MTDPQSAVDRIRAWNARFETDLVLRKYAAMRTNVFAFFRGTNHLFYDDWPGGGLDEAPSSWLSGDLHLENFGVYKADNGLQYFDVNDFDEACLAPITRDVTRLLTSILIGSQTWKIVPQGIPRDASQWCHTALDAYAVALGGGKAHDVERELATGVVHKLFEGARRRTRRMLLDAHTSVHKKRRRFIPDDQHILPATSDEATFVTALVAVAATRLRQRWPSLSSHFFDVHDVARRVAGIGSLGARRYAVIIEGQGSPNRNVLLDVKEALPSTTVRGVRCEQPPWSSEAERSATVQQRVQGEPPAFLASVTSAEAGSSDGASFIVHRLQPIANKLSLAGRKKPVTQALLEELACIAAWSHLRGVGWRGGPTADTCMAFASGDQWRAAVFEYARAYAQTATRDYTDFCDAYDAGALTSSFDLR